MFWSRCDKALHLQLYQYTTFLILRSCAYLDSLGKSGFRVKSGFKRKCRARATSGLALSASGRFGLQTEARLQLWTNCPTNFANLNIHASVAKAQILLNPFWWNYWFSVSRLRKIEILDSDNCSDAKRKSITHGILNSLKQFVDNNGSEMRHSTIWQNCHWQQGNVHNAAFKPVTKSLFK